MKGERKRKAVQRVMRHLQQERLPCTESLLWPVFIATAIAVKTTSKGPIFFVQNPLALKVCEAVRDDGFKVLVTGGSQGASVLSEVVPDGLAMLPPALVVMLMQKWFVKGLVDTEK